MVFGDNVRARRAARALPRTPTQKEKEEEEEEEEEPKPTHPPRPSTQHKPPPLFHNDTTLSQRHSTKPTML